MWLLCALFVANVALHEESISDSSLCNLGVLCAISVFSVPLWLRNLFEKTTTETQRTPRLHREIGLFVQSWANVKLATDRSSQLVAQVQDTQQKQLPPTKPRLRQT